MQRFNSCVFAVIFISNRLENSKTRKLIAKGIILATLNVICVTVK